MVDLSMVMLVYQRVYQGFIFIFMFVNQLWLLLSWPSPELSPLLGSIFNQPYPQADCRASWGWVTDWMGEWLPPGSLVCNQWLNLLTDRLYVVSSGLPCLESGRWFWHNPLISSHTPGLHNLRGWLMVCTTLLGFLLAKRAPPLGGSSHEWEVISNPGC